MGSPRLPTFGRYHASALVGEGSSSRVYRAEHAELDRTAAIKELKPRIRSTPQAVATLRSEASVLARLDHPNIVAFYDFVEEPDRSWLAEGWIDGAPLDEMLARHGQLSPEQALGVLTGALTGLAHAHQHDVIHRDIAASNILADLSGTSMLIDFGLAVPVPADDHPAPGPALGTVVGTPAYLSPEAAAGQPVGKAGDVYSAAALTYHLLVGRTLFAGTPWAMVAAHGDDQPPDLDGHGPRLRALLAASLAKDPAQRPPDAATFLAELEEAAKEEYGVGWRRRSSIAAIVAATAGTTSVIAGTAAAPVAPGSSSPITSATAAVVNTGRRTGLKVALAAGATAAVVAAVVTTWVVAASNNDPVADRDPGSEAAPPGGTDGQSRSAGSSTGDAASEDTTEPDDAAFLPEDLTLQRRPFCKQVDEVGVVAAMGKPIKLRIFRNPGDTYEVGGPTVTIEDYQCVYAGPVYSSIPADGSGSGIEFARGITLAVSGTRAGPAWVEPPDYAGQCAVTRVDPGPLGPDASGVQCVDDGPREDQVYRIFYKTLVGGETGFRCSGTLPAIEAHGFNERVLDLCLATLEQLTQ